MAELFGEMSSDDELKQPSEYMSQVEGGSEELWLLDGQPGSEDAHSVVDSLAAELGGARRHQAEQQSKYSLNMEYLKRDLEVQVQTADEALRQLRQGKREMATEMGKVQAELQAQQTQAAGLLHALRQEQSRCAWQQACITHLTHQLASLQAEITQLKAAQASHVERALLQAQNNAKREHLERVSEYQAAELMTLQRQIYQLRSLMTTHGLDRALASEVAALSPWSMATTPEHLWDTSSLTMTPPSSRTQGLSSTQELSPAPQSQGLSHTAAFMPCGSSTCSAQGLKITSAAPAAISPAQPGASAGRHYASTEHSLHAASHSLILSGSPMAGLGRTGPRFAVRTTKKQQARQDAVAAALSRSTSASAATASGTSSTLASAHHSAGAPAVKRRPDSTAGTAATPSPAAGKPSIRGGRGPLAGGTPLLSTGRRPSLRGSKSCLMAHFNCHSNRDTTSKENGCSDSNKENSPGTGKTRTPATSSLQVIQQQPLASRALLQLTPCSPTACKSPSTAMADGDETPSSPGFSPHALQLHVLPVPFWGLPAPVSLPAAADDCATAEGTLGTVTPAASAPASAAAASVPAALAATATATTAALPDQTPIARTLHVLDAVQAAAPAASVERSQACLPKRHADRQHKPFDIIDTVSMPFQAPASSATISSQYIISDNHAAHSPPRQAMVAGSADIPMATGDMSPTSPLLSSHALQVRMTHVPFRGLPAASPLAAATNTATAASNAGSTTTAATSVPAPPATAPASVAAALASRATATTAAVMLPARSGASSQGAAP